MVFCVPSWLLQEIRRTTPNKKRGNRKASLFGLVLASPKMKESNKRVSKMCRVNKLVVYIDLVMFAQKPHRRRAALGKIPLPKDREVNLS